MQAAPPVCVCVSVCGGRESECARQWTVHARHRLSPVDGDTVRGVTIIVTRIMCPEWSSVTPDTASVCLKNTSYTNKYNIVMEIL